MLPLKVWSCVLPAMVLLISVFACDKPAKKSPAISINAAPSASQIRLPKPFTQKQVDALLNPEGQKEYSGPTGTIFGVVRVTGDTAPEQPEVVKRLPLGKCVAAHKMYSKLFREGPGRTLADALVAVTEYKGLVLPKESLVPMLGRDCAFDSRTYALTFGQGLSLSSRGTETYTPDLVGTNPGALLLAIPGGNPVNIFPPKPGYYQVVDRSHPFNGASVYVLGYPTVDVSGIDGRFEVTGVPVGRAKVSALLPQTNTSISKEIEVIAGERTETELVLTFDVDSWQKPKEILAP